MRLTGAQMQDLVTLINGGIERPTLARVVRFRLDVDINDIVEDGSTKLDAVFQVIDWCARRQLAEELIDGIVNENGGLRPALLKIIEDARRADVVALVPAAAVTATPSDPLAPYFPLDEPFVDRQKLTDRLDELWLGGRSGVLVVRGDRYSGRSHSWWRIVDAASSTRVTACRIDVSRDPGTWKVGKLVERVASELQIDRQGLKDGLAQGSTQSGALVNALIAHFRHWQGERWCLVLDGLDRPGVEPAIIELVEDLIAEVLSRSIPPLSVILLGYGEHSQQTFRARILTEQIQWLQRSDLCTWLDAVARAVGNVAQQSDLDGTAAAVFNGIAPPFDAETMDQVRDRVKIHTRDLLRRL